MAAASAIGLQLDVVQAGNSREIEAAFGTLVRNRADALLVGPDLVFLTRRLQLATLAARHAIPAVYNVREYPEAGGPWGGNRFLRLSCGCRGGPFWPGSVPSGDIGR
jgi:putative ABC transport system substrate-binding protein